MRDVIRARNKTLRAIPAIAAAVVIAALGVPSAQAAPTGGASPQSLVAGYAPDVANAAASALAGTAALSRNEAAQRLTSQPARIQLGERMVAQLGSRAAGMWLDQRGDTVVVNVLDDAAAATVRAAGADARVVKRSTAELTSMRDKLAAARVTDTAVGIDFEKNQVLLQIGKKAEGAAVAGMLTTAARFGDAVRVEHLDGTFGTLISGGFPIVNGGSFCSLGFSTTGNTGVTAGHCTRAIPQWWDGATGLFYGPSIHFSFPGNDFGLIRNDGGLPQPGDVYLYNGTFQDIATAAWPAQNMGICKSGARTGLTCGTVIALEQIVCYPEGCVDNMAATNVVAGPGDSGGSWFAGNIAFGLTSGGGGGVTFFQPVVEALNFYGIWVF